MTRRSRKPQVFNETLSWFPYDKVQCDLIQIDSLHEYNGGVKFLLCCLDCYSRYLDVEPLKDKRCITVTQALEKIIQRLTKVPRVVSSDRGVYCWCFNSEIKSGVTNYHVYLLRWRI